MSKSTNQQSVLSIKNTTQYIFVILLLTLLAGLVNAQEHPQYTKSKQNFNYLEAKVFLQNGDTIPALVKDFPTEYRWYGDRVGKIPFVLKSTGKVKYTASEIRGYRVKRSHGRWKTYITHEGSYLKLKFKGRHLTLYDTQGTSYGTNPAPGGGVIGNAYYDYYLKKASDKTIIKLIKKKFNKGIYFEGCPSLQSEIISKKYRFKDLVEVVKKYDACL